MEGLGRGELRWGWSQAPGGGGTSRVLAYPFLSWSPRARPTAEPSSRQQGAPRRLRAGGRGAQNRRRSLSEWAPRPRPRRGSGTRPGRDPSPRSPPTEARPTAPPPPSAPARKRRRRGGGAGKRFRGRGARAGAAAGAAGTGLAPAAAEGAPRAGDVSAALSAGEARRAGAAGGGRGAGGAGGPGGAALGRCPAPSGRGGAGASAPGQSGGWAGGAGRSRGRAGSGGPGTCSGQARPPKGPIALGPGVRAPPAGRRVAFGQLTRAPQPPPRASRDPLLPGPSLAGALPFCTGRPDG